MPGHLTVPTALVSDDMTVVLKSATAPLSGTSGTGAASWAAPGALMRCTTTGVLYVNEGTLASPYWTPTSYGQFGLLAYATDFRSGLGSPIANTNAADVIADGTGIRAHGSGIEQTDSGLTVAFAEGGPIASVIASAADARLVSLSHPGVLPIYQPDTHGPIVIDADVAMSSALTLRRFFLGFLGTIADALVTPATGTTTTITLVQDDMAGLFYDAALTAAARLFAPHNKSDEAATIATNATGVDTGVDFPAAGTYVRLRVEISAAGVMTCFVNKAQVTQIAAALDADEEIAPSLIVCSTSAATKTMLVKRVAFWGNRG